MDAPYTEMSLPDFVSLMKSQQSAAEALGCSQGNIAQALGGIARGKKKVIVKVYKDGTAEAEAIRPFGKKADPNSSSPAAA